jgi:hypothetical protein
VMTSVAAETGSEVSMPEMQAHLAQTVATALGRTTTT